MQLSRRKGFRLQAASLALNGLPGARVARPGKWGNPYRIGDAGVPDAATAVQMHRDWLASVMDPLAPSRAVTIAALGELRGKNLACWCKPDSPCHADTLLELANR